jgi:hypothetical protein
MCESPSAKAGAGTTSRVCAYFCPLAGTMLTASAT